MSAPFPFSSGLIHHLPAMRESLTSFDGQSIAQPKPALDGTAQIILPIVIQSSADREANCLTKSGTPFLLERTTLLV
jgi:hypothetical protein